MVKFTNQVIVNRTYEMSAEEFVKWHLREIRAFPKSNGETEYDLYVQDGVNGNFIVSVITMTNIGEIHSNFDKYAHTDEEKAAHQKACQDLVVALEKKFAK
ncbi:hypothetical protein Asfd1_43 [Aeromonas phage Asfd_1]|nr:hypothetical protein Asfd1_43 [Aeromonas phage Asfd_1]